MRFKLKKQSKHVQPLQVGPDRSVALRAIWHMSDLEQNGGQNLPVLVPIVLATSSLEELVTAMPALAREAMQGMDAFADNIESDTQGWQNPEKIAEFRESAHRIRSMLGRAACVAALVEMGG